MSSAAGFKLGPWTVSPGLNLLDNGERSVKIEPRAMDLLVRLAERPGEVISVEDMFSSVWRGVVVSDNSVYVAIRQLRQALDVPGAPSCIETIPKRGYRLTAPIDRTASATLSSAPIVGSAVAAPRSGGGRRIPWLVGLALAAGTAFALLAFRQDPAPPARQQHWLAAAADYVAGGLAISPNGEHIVYLAVTDGVRQLWLRPTDSTQARPLSGTQDASKVFWSADSRSIAFTTRSSALEKIDIAGGPPVALTDDAQYASAGGAWDRDGTIFVTTKVAKTFPIGILTPQRHLSPATAVDFAGGETGHFVPRPLPDGDHFLYVAGGHNLPTADIYVGSRAVPSERVRLLPIVNTVKHGRLWSLAFADGFLLYVNDTTLFAQRFDAGTLTLQGEPVALHENVDEFSVSATGLLVYTEYEAQNRAPVLQRLAWFGRRGERLGAVDTPPADFVNPRLSPDGQRIAVSIPTPGPGFSDVSIVAAETGVTAPLTFDQATDAAPIWSPQGSHVVFTSARTDTPLFLPNALYRRPADGSGTDELLFAGVPGEIVLPFDWSADGEQIVFGRTNNNGRDADIWVLPVSHPQAARALVATDFREHSARLSRDGRWIAYVTNETGRDQVFVKPFPEVERGRWQVSADGGSNPRWRGDGRELFYLDPDGVLQAVDLETGGDVVERKPPRALFRTGLTTLEVLAFGVNPYDVTADGERFLLRERAAAGSDAAQNTATPILPIHVIVNWTAGLDRE